MEWNLFIAKKKRKKNARHWIKYVPKYILHTLLIWTKIFHKMAVDARCWRRKTWLMKQCQDNCCTFFFFLFLHQIFTVSMQPIRNYLHRSLLHNVHTTCYVVYTLHDHILTFLVVKIVTIFRKGNMNSVLNVMILKCYMWCTVLIVKVKRNVDYHQILIL